MQASQLAAELQNNKTWEGCENRLIDLMTTGHEVLDFKREPGGFLVTLNGTAKPVKIPYKPGGVLQKASPAPKGDLDSFEASDESAPPSKPAPPPPKSKKPKVIIVPRPTQRKEEPGELMMSLDGLMVKYEKHVKQIIRFSLIHAGMAEADIDQAVDEISPKWITETREKLPSKP